MYYLKKNNIKNTFQNRLQKAREFTKNTKKITVLDVEYKNKVTLGLMVALAAEKKGHDVTLFLAADGVHVLNCKSAGEIVGQGTGDLHEHLENLKNTNDTIFVSGMFAKARGYDDSLLDGYKAEFAMPDRLVEESIKSDSVLCY